MSDQSADRIDFSSIDPSRDGERWERLVASVSRRARAVVTAQTVWGQLASWWRPALAAAAVVAIALVGAAIVSGGTSGASVRRPPDPDPAGLVRWAMGDGSGSAWDDIAILGGIDDQP